MKRQSFFMILAVGSLMLIGCATTQGVYLNDDGSTFTQNFSGLFSVTAPSSITDDAFLQSEIVRTYMENVTEYYREPSIPSNLGVVDGGGVTGSRATIGRTYQIIETYEVTVTRHWYNRTTYYQDRKPTYNKVYNDQETRRLINTQRIYLN
jgi:hypothetical protein